MDRPLLTLFICVFVDDWLWCDTSRLALLGFGGNSGIWDDNHFAGHCSAGFSKERVAHLHSQWL